MTRIKRATPEEKAEYARGGPVYPLHGWITAHMQDGTTQRCAVEYVGDKDNEIMYEVMAPRGHHFTPEFLHSMLGQNARDIENRVACNRLEPCGERCDGYND